MTKWTLKRTEPLEVEELFFLKDGLNSLGRSHDNDVRCYSIQVSRFHAKITIKPDKPPTLVDFKSFNGTWRNGMKIKPNTEEKLRDGDVIGLGGEDGTPGKHTFVLGFVKENEGSGGVHRPNSTEESAADTAINFLETTTPQAVRDIERAQRPVRNEETILEVIRRQEEEGTSKPSPGPGGFVPAPLADVFIDLVEDEDVRGNEEAVTAPSPETVDMIPAHSGGAFVDLEAARREEDSVSKPSSEAADFIDLVDDEADKNKPEKVSDDDVILAQDYIENGQKPSELPDYDSDLEIIEDDVELSFFQDHFSQCIIVKEEPPDEVQVKAEPPVYCDLQELKAEILEKTQQAASPEAKDLFFKSELIDVKVCLPERELDVKNVLPEPGPIEEKSTAPQECLPEPEPIKLTVQQECAREISLEEEPVAPTEPLPNEQSKIPPPKPKASRKILPCEPRPLRAKRKNRSVPDDDFVSTVHGGKVCKTHSLSEKELKDLRKNERRKKLKEIAKKSKVLQESKVNLMKPLGCPQGVKLSSTNRLDGLLADVLRDEEAAKTGPPKKKQKHVSAGAHIELKKGREETLTKVTGERKSSVEKPSNGFVEVGESLIDETLPKEVRTRKKTSKEMPANDVSAEAGKDEVPPKNQTVSDATALEPAKATRKKRTSKEMEEEELKKPTKLGRIPKKVCTTEPVNTPAPVVQEPYPDLNPDVRVSQKITRRKSHDTKLLNGCIILVPKLSMRPKRKVTFDDDVKVRWFECEGKLGKFTGKDLLRPSMHQVSLLPSHTVNNLAFQNVLTYLETVQRMCYWEFEWLKIYKKRKDLPFELNLFYTKDIFISARDCQQTFYPLLLLELWTSVVSDYDSRKPIVVGEVLSWKPPSPLDAPLDPSLTPLLGPLMSLQTLECRIFVKGFFLPSCYVPQSQELVMMRSQNRTVFGFIKDVQPPRPVRTTDEDPFLMMKRRPTEGIQGFNVQFTVLVRGDVSFNQRTFQMQSVRNLYMDLRYFTALSVLPFSNLREILCDPTTGNFHIEESRQTSFISTLPLNDSQKKAITNTVRFVKSPNPGVFLIKGPPGTGKTSTIISIVLEILYGDGGTRNVDRSVRPKVLICAPSNAAVDEISMRLMDVRHKMPDDRKYRFVRHGPLKYAHVAVHDVTVKKLANKNVLNELDDGSLKTDLNTLNASRSSVATSLETCPSISDAKRKALEDKYHSIQEKINQIKKFMEEKSRKGDVENSQFVKWKRREMEETILKQADIICSTLGASTFREMEQTSHGSGKFTCCIIDEATQATEPESLLPLILNVDKLILIGDPKQLPPTVLSQAAKKHGLGTSLFSRLYNTFSTRHDCPLVMLDTQYRMNPEIVMWPSSFFYGGKILNGSNIRQRSAGSINPYLVVSHKMNEDPGGEANSKEAELILHLLSHLKRGPDGKRLKVSIIIPYNKQKHLVTQKWAELRDKNPCDLPEVQIQTVDSFQGKEEDNVIFAGVRSEGIGFLADRTRINVALTRARYSLCVIAHNSMFQNPVWKSLYINAVRRRKLMDIEGRKDFDAVLSSYISSQTV